MVINIQTSNTAKNRQRGSAYIEFSLALIGILTMGFSVLELSRVMQAEYMASTMAIEAAHVGIKCAWSQGGAEALAETNNCARHSLGKLSTVIAATAVLAPSGFSRADGGQSRPYVNLQIRDYASGSYTELGQHIGDERSILGGFGRCKGISSVGDAQYDSTVNSSIDTMLGQLAGIAGVRPVVITATVAIPVRSFVPLIDDLVQTIYGGRNYICKRVDIY